MGREIIPKEKERNSFLDMNYGAIYDPRYDEGGSQGIRMIWVSENV